MSEKTGLSVATCNTILRELARENIVIFEERQMHDVGRKTCVYHINTSYDSVAYLFCTENEGGAGGGKMSLLVGYRYGGQRAYQEMPCADLSAERIEDFLRKELAAYEGVSQAIVCLPYSPAADLAMRLEEVLAVPVYAARDMDFWIKHYFRTRGKGEKSISFLSLNDGSPCLFNAYEGRITGKAPSSLQYLPFGAEDMVNVVLSVLAVYSPEEVVFVGNGEKSAEVQALHKECLDRDRGRGMEIPPFSYYPRQERDYFFGMFYSAAELRGTEN
jgi:hypothetical protein